MFLTRIFLLATIFFVILITPAMAHETSSENLQLFVNLYNSVYDKNPNTFKSLVGTETIKITFKLADGDEIIFGVKTEDGKITGSNPTPYTESTLAITLSEQILQKVAQSKDPITELRNAWGSEIKVEGLTFASKIKVFVTGLLLSFLKLFSGSPQVQQGK